MLLFYFSSVVDCRTPPNIDNGFTEYSETVYNAELRYFCNPGFSLNGNSIRKCLENGNWSGVPPQCISQLKKFLF